MPLANGPKAFAPETAIGTGAKFPLADEVEMANLTPSVDASTAGQGKNKPRANENSDMKPSGDELAEPTDNRNSTGEDEETRENANAHARDADANKVASTVRPTAPQANRSNARPKNSVVKPGLPK